MPGLGQVVNRQPLKGFILIGLTTIVFLSVLVKVFLDLTVVIGQVMGAGLTLEPNQYSQVVTGMRERSLGFLLSCLIVFLMIWTFGVVDAFITGRGIRSEPEE